MNVYQAIKKRRAVRSYKPDSVSEESLKRVLGAARLAPSAVEEGLGTCWVGGFSQKEVKEILKIPEKYKVVALMPLGFPADKPTSKLRKNLEEITCYENFTE